MVGLTAGLKPGRKLSGLFKALREGFLGLFLTRPYRCPLCGDTFSGLPPSPGPGVANDPPIWFPAAGCPRCLAALPFVVPPLCSQCGRPLRQTAADLCANCRRYRHFFNVARAVGVYDGSLRHWIQLLKYGDRVEIGAGLGALLAELACLDPLLQGIEAVVPVPVSPERQRERGYNQAELLARPVVARLGRPLVTDAVVRVAGGVSQSLLTGTQRRRNAFGLYALGSPAGVAGRRVLLVDDILTTGATADEVARLLLKAGALEVKVLVAAVGVQRADWGGGPVRDGSGDGGAGHEGIQV